MSLTTRVLPPDEWGRLDGHPLLGGYSLPPASGSEFVVAERDGRLVGGQGLVTVVHLEPIWVDPAERGGAVAGRLWREATTRLNDRGIARAFCFADRDEIAGYLRRLGLRELPFRTFYYEGQTCLQS